MIKVEALTLEEAYSKAASELSCSVTELELNVIQYPSGGFLGFGKKIAIVEAKRIGRGYSHPKAKNERANEPKYENHQNKKDKNRQKERNFDRKNVHTNRENLVKDEQKDKKNVEIKTEKQPFLSREKANPATIVGEVKNGLVRLFKHSCYDISKIEVSVFDEDTLLVEFDGEDAALLIGKEGYRYKAISYLIYNWVNIKYGLNIRLEIAEFLKNKEEMIDSYLENVIERVKNQGRGQTKILDGVLIKIALEKLRTTFPEKYVGIKNGRDGGRFIVVNDFNRKEK